MLEQVMIMILGCAAVWFSQQGTDTRRRWASVCGLLGQPFWFLAAWKAGQWGIFGAAVLYTYSWSVGLWRYWVVPWRTRRQFYTAWDGFTVKADAKWKKPTLS